HGELPCAESVSTSRFAYSRSSSGEGTLMSIGCSRRPAGLAVVGTCSVEPVRRRRTATTATSPTTAITTTTATKTNTSNRPCDCDDGSTPGDVVVGGGAVLAGGVKELGYAGVGVDGAVVCDPPELKTMRIEGNTTAISRTAAQPITICAAEIPR